MEEHDDHDERLNGPRALVTATIGALAFWAALAVIAWAIWWRE